MEALIAKRYAQALTSASQDITTASEVLNELSVVVETKEVMRILTSPIVSIDQKTEMMVSALGNEADATLVNFIKVLGENSRLDLVPSIAKVLRSDLQAISNAYEGVLRVKKDLDEETLARLEKTLALHTGATIKLKQERSEVDDLRVSVDDLGIEVNFSKQRVKDQLIDFIQKSL